MKEARATTKLEPIESFSLQQAFIWASQQVINSGKDQIELDHLLSGIMHQPESYSAYYVEVQGITLTDLLYELCHQGQDDEEDANMNNSTSDEEGTGEMQQDEASLEKLSSYVTNLNELVKKETEPLVGKTAINKGLARKINEGNVPNILLGTQIFELDLGATLAGDPISRGF